MVRPPAGHLLALLQRYPLDSGHVHDAQPHHPSSPVELLRTLGVGHHLQDQFTSSNLLSLPFMCCPGKLAHSWFITYAADHCYNICYLPVMSTTN